MEFGPYLTFEGNCEEAMNYYKDILDGEYIVLMRYSDGPPEYLNPSNENKIMHVTMKFRNSELKASDRIGNPVPKGKAHHLSLSIDNEEDAVAIFNGLADGGEVEMPFNDVFWGGKFGSLVDKFGIQWMISAGHNSNTEST